MASPGGSAPTVTLGTILLQDGQLNISIPSLAGVKCYIEATDSLESAQWEVIDQMTGDGQIHILRVQTTGLRQFIRVRFE